MDDFDKLYDELKDVNPNIPDSEQPQGTPQVSGPEPEEQIPNEPKLMARPDNKQPKLIFNSKDFKAKLKNSEQK